MTAWQIIIGTEVFAIMIFGASGILLWKKSRKEMRINSLVKKKARESELDKDLLNPIASENNKKAEHTANIAYDVQYHEEKELSAEEMIAVQLRIESPLATRKHLVQIKDMISIGSEKGNIIQVVDTGVAGVHCCLIHKQHRLYVEKAAGAFVQMKRKQKINEIGKIPSELKVGDGIILGNSLIEVLSITY